MPDETPSEEKLNLPSAKVQAIIAADDAVLYQELQRLMKTGGSLISNAEANRMTLFTVVTGEITVPILHWRVMIQRALIRELADKELAEDVRNAGVYRAWVSENCVPRTLAGF